MSTHPKRKGSYVQSTHKIYEIDYSEDKLECICGWIGRAWDDPEFAGDEKDWPHHRKTAEPIDILAGKYAPSTHAIGIKKKRVLVESY